MSNNKKCSLALVLTLSLTSCFSSGKSDSESTSSYGILNASIIDAQKGRDSRLSTSGDPKLGGIYFGELEIVGYSYRPGKKIQAWDKQNAFEGADWSYWLLLHGGHEAARNNVLRPGEELDLNSLNGDYGSRPSDEFVKAVGKFSLDFLGVSIYRPGIIYDNAFYGSGVITNSNPLYKYPDFSTLPQYLAANPGIGGFAGFPGHGDPSDATQRINIFSIFFARDDWFPEPFLVTFDGNRQLEHSTIALNANQVSILSSFASQNPQRISLYNHYVFVPYKLRRIGLHRNSLKENGVSPSSRALISFELSDVIEVGASFSGDTSMIKFKRDANNVPLGIKLAFE